MAQRHGEQVQSKQRNVDARDYAREEVDEDDGSDAGDTATKPQRQEQEPEAVSSLTASLPSKGETNSIMEDAVPRGLGALTSYLSSLERSPCGVLDLTRALVYASGPVGSQTSVLHDGTERKTVTQSTLSVYSNDALKAVTGPHGLTLESLTASSQAIYRGFLIDSADGRLAPKLKLEFLSSFPESEDGKSASSRDSASDRIVVEFTIGKVAPEALQKKLRLQFPRGLLVLHGRAITRTPRVEPTRHSNRTHSDKTTSQVTLDSNKPAVYKSTNREKPFQMPSSNSTRRDAHAIYLTGLNFHAFTRQPCLLPDTKAGRMFQNFAWHETPLGPLQMWPAQYIGYAVMVLSIPSPAYLALTPQYLQIYNDSFGETLSVGEYSTTFGQPMEQAWGESWGSTIKPLVQRATAERCSLLKKDHLVWQDASHIRYGLDARGKSTTQAKDEASVQVTETYQTISYTPLVADDNVEIDGFVSFHQDTTAAVLAQRQLATLRDLQRAVAPALSLKDMCERTARCLESNPVDLPFVLLYSAHVYKEGQGVTASGTTQTTSSNTPYSEDQTDATSHSSQAFSGSLLLRLRASCGLLEAHEDEYRQFVVNLDAHESEHGENAHPFPFEEAIHAGSLRHTFLPEDIAEHFAERSWQNKTKRAVVCPVQLDDKHHTTLVMVVGLNTRQAYQNTYANWLSEISGALKAGLTSADKLAREQRHFAKLQSLTNARTNFYSGVSHELRTPLTLIQGPVNDALADARLPTKERPRYEMIAKASGRLLRLVNSLLDFASVESGRLNITFRPTKLSVYIEDIASLFRTAFEREGIQYNVIIEDCGEVYTDISCLEKVVYNLLSNALKYTPAGSVTVKCFLEDDTFILEVADTGIGLSEEDARKIFDRFYRSAAQSSRSIEGSGIGLALARDLTRLLRGSLSVKSTLSSEEQAGGSIFTLTLPLGYVHLPQDHVNHEMLAPVRDDKMNSYSRRAAADHFIGISAERDMPALENDSLSEATTSDELVGTREANVLLVDDNDDLRDYIASLLKGICRNVTGVANGKEALRILQTNARIDLVITDIMMPVMDGFELLKALRSDEKLAKLPVIVLSAKTSSEAQANGMAIGATDYLAKPFSSRELIARVRTHLANAKQAQRLEGMVLEKTAMLMASERRAERLMSILPVGVFEATAEGHVIYYNTTWQQMSSWPENTPLFIDEWYDRVRAEDRPRVQKAMGEALATGGTVSGTRTFTAHWQWASAASQGHTKGHCFASIHPTGDGFIGVFTDITPSVHLSEQALQHEKQRAGDALNLARSQESFLDVVSHELRNPLSAVLNSADLCVSNIKAVLAAMKKIGRNSDDDAQRQTVTDMRSELEEAFDSVQGIIASAQHQSLIAGDILSVSKLHQGLLTITPQGVALIRELQKTLSMFQMQTRSHGIDLGLYTYPTELADKDLVVLADPTRLTQILVNLLSNSTRVLENYIGDRSCNIHCHVLTKPPDIAAFQSGTDKALQSIDENHYIKPDVPYGTDVWIMFLVRDSGPGMSAELQGRLFTRFNQVQGVNTGETSHSNSGGGAGLGLYLAKMLAEMMGGAMLLYSKLGHGADFIFYIKSTKVDPITVKGGTDLRSRLPQYTTRTNGTTSSQQSVSASGSSNDDHRLSTPTIGMNGGTEGNSRRLVSQTSLRSNIRVLIVEDNKLNQKLLDRQLSRAGFDTEVADHGLDAVDKLLKAYAVNSPLVACLMDLEMPICGGNEAAKRIRELESQGKLPGRLTIHAITGNARPEHAIAALKAGMDSVITKPYTIQDVMVKLDELATKNR